VKFFGLTEERRLILLFLRDAEETVRLGDFGDPYRDHPHYDPVP
jgi:hypothetical protein